MIETFINLRYTVSQQEFTKSGFVEADRMIWDKLSPFYGMFEMLYNGKVFKGIAKEIKNTE